MKILTVKNFVLTVFQIPFLLVLWFVNYLQLFVYKCLMRIENPLSMPLAQLAENTIDKTSKSTSTDNTIEISDSQNTIDKAVADTIDTAMSNVQTILALFSLRSSYKLNQDRQLFEATPAGRQAVVTNPDRHLYAVQRPTRQENLQRIGNVLFEMNPAELSRVLENAGKMLGLCDGE